MIRLFENAGMKDATRKVVEPAGMGHVVTRQLSNFNNMHFLNGEFQGAIAHYFTQTIGVYKMHRDEALNPFYWVETLIRLPSKALGYLGFNSDGTLAKAMNVIYWILTVWAAIVALPDFAWIADRVSTFLVDLF